MIKRFRTVLCLALLAFCMALCTGCSEAPEQSAPQDGNGQAAKTQASSVDEGYRMVDHARLVKTIEAARGKVVVLNFWTTWCPGCRQELAELNNLRAAFPQDKLEILGVSLDENAEVLDRFFQKVPVNYTVLLGTRDAAQKFKVSTIPRLLIYDRAGKLVLDKVGVVPFPELKRMIDILLG